MSDTKTKRLTLIALTGLDASAEAPVVLPTEFRLFAKGVNPSSKGDFLFDDEAATAVMESYRQHGIARLPIDFDHGSTASDVPAGSGRAAGWFTPQVRDGELWATQISWTEEAAAQLSDHQWGYFSPAFVMDIDSGRVVDLLAVALTNLPALDGIPMLIAANRSDELAQNVQNQAPAPTADTTPAPAPVAEVVTLDIKGTPEFIELARTHESTVVELAQVKTALAQARERIASFERAALERKVDDTIQAGVSAKRVTPAMVPSLREAGLKDPEWLSRHVATMPVIAALSAAPMQTAPVGKYTGKSFTEMKPSERAQLYQDNRELYNALRAESMGRKSA